MKKWTKLAPIVNLQVKSFLGFSLRNLFDRDSWLEPNYTLNRLLATMDELAQAKPKS